MAQDAIGSSLVDSSNIDLSYDDALGQITADLKNTTVTPSTYGGTSLVSITVDSKGRITNLSNAGSLALGDNFENFSDLTAFTTTSSSNQVAATFTTSSKAIGKYRIGMCFSWTVNVTNSDAIFGIYVDNVLLSDEFRMEVSEISNQNIPFSWFDYVTFGSETTHTIELRARLEFAGVTVTVNQVVAEMWRTN